MRRVILACMPALVWLLGAGCNRSPAPGMVISLGAPNGSASWNYDGPDKGPPVPGIDQGSVCYAGHLFLLWTDSSGGGSDHSRGGPNGFTADGHLTMRGDRRVPYTCESPDGKVGQMVIDGKAYDLENGRFFLLATAGDKVVVQQLSKEFPDLRVGSPHDFRGFAQSDPEIAAFFRAAKR